MWLVRVPNSDLLVKAPTFERGSYLFFDPSVWEIGRKVRGEPISTSARTGSSRGRDMDPQVVTHLWASSPCLSTL